MTISTEPAYVVRSGGWWLRNTIWTGDPERASRFTTEADARAGLLKAKQFTKPAAYRAAIIELAAVST